MTERLNGESKGVGCSAVLVLTMGVALALIGAAAGGGCTVEIPATGWNVSMGGSFGSKHDMQGAPPTIYRMKKALMIIFSILPNLVTSAH